MYRMQWWKTHLIKSKLNSKHLLINVCFYDTLENHTSNILFLIFSLVPKLTPLFPDENVGVLTNSGINIFVNYFDNNTYRFTYT